MSRFDGNPFDEGSSSNPYADTLGPSSGISAHAPPATTATGSFFDTRANDRSAPISETTPLPSIRLAPLPPESKAGTALGAAADIPFSPRSLKQKQKELQAREAELRRKERELASREDSVGVMKANWPPFLPIIRHDIRADIPEYLRALQRTAFFTWMGAILALVYNFVAVTLAWIVGAVPATTGLANFFLALILILLGVPLSYFLWYRRLYNSLKNDSSFGLVLFFISYTSHILWFTLFAVSPPIVFGGKFVCGVLTTIDMFSSGNNFIGIMYAIGASFFISEVALSIIVIGRVYAYFRGNGKANKLKQEAAMSALRNAV